MITMNVLREIKRMRMTCLFLFLLLAVPPASWATYEVPNSKITSNVLVSTPTPWTDDLTVSWEAPAMGGDTLNGFAYKWSDSASALSYEVFNDQTGNDGFVRYDLPLTVVKDKAALTALDYNNWLYLHLKTCYTSGAQATCSDDVVTGPFMIDNIAPTGTVRVVDANGNDITSTSNTNVKVKLAPSPDTTKVYLNESPTPLTSLQLICSNCTDAEYPFADTTPGAKTIYVWFQDAAGNITPTQSPATDAVTLLASISINPYDATIDLSVGTQVFQVGNGTIAYKWDIINQVQDPSGTNVATFANGSTSIASATQVTVTAKNKGTFKLTAGALTSGEIKVTQSVKPGDVDGDSEISLNDVKLAFSFFSGGTFTAQQFAGANVYDDGDSNMSVSLHDVKGVFTLYSGGTL